jgi:hypothetical protein
VTTPHLRPSNAAAPCGWPSLSDVTALTEAG